MSRQDSTNLITPAGRQQPPRNGRAQMLRRWATILVVATCVVSPLTYLEFAPWERAYRDGAIPVMSAELARLPSLGGSPERSRRALAELNSPYLVAYYPQAASCDQVQSHYQQVVGETGWSPGSSDSVVPPLERSYHKVVGGYYLTLVVVCAAGTERPAPTAPSDYSLHVNIPFPYSVALIGPWFPKG
jgi:hypothetical protein